MWYWYSNVGILILCFCHNWTSFCLVIISYYIAINTSIHSHKANITISSAVTGLASHISLIHLASVSISLVSLHLVSPVSVFQSPSSVTGVRLGTLGPGSDTATGAREQVGAVLRDQCSAEKRKNIAQIRTYKGLEARKCVLCIFWSNK